MIILSQVIILNILALEKIHGHIASNIMERITLISFLILNNNWQQGIDSSTDASHSGVCVCTKPSDWMIIKHAWALHCSVNLVLNMLTVGYLVISQKIIYFPTTIRYAFTLMLLKKTKLASSIVSKKMGLLSLNKCQTLWLKTNCLLYNEVNFT